MKKLRNGFLVTLVLTAVLLTVGGTGSSAAGTNGYRSGLSSPTSLSPRPALSPFSGEPDAGGTSAPVPPKVTGASYASPVQTWAQRLWIIWLARNWASLNPKSR